MPSGFTGAGQNLVRVSPKWSGEGPVKVRPGFPLIGFSANRRIGEVAKWPFGVALGAGPGVARAHRRLCPAPFGRVGSRSRRLSRPPVAVCSPGATSPARQALDLAGEVAPGSVAARPPSV
ncbi:hypothetical protein GCM10010517_44410 [Streptosporangium fragile]|uniref:Uncharacterized protein n=1 Tax=Streptosporangium fragile TaxID=46186 RepID=A0ABN3W0H5_9ACTN